MSKLFPPKFIVSLSLLLSVILVGCTHQKTQRGHLFRGDWAVEYNRTPWIGCPPDSGCPDDYQNVGQESKRGGLFSCLTKDGDDRNLRGFRRHCAMNSGCTQKNPCCRTLGCGMWMEPDATNSTMPASLGGSTRACGLTPFCFPNSPCRVTPNCGKPANSSPNVNPQTLSIKNQQALAGFGGVNGLNGSNTIAMNNAGAGLVPGGMAAINGMTANGMLANGMSANGMTVNGAATVRGMSPNGTMSNGVMSNGVMANGGVIGAAPSGTLVSRGIVPGASAITSGGMVAAIGVTTPAGTMMPTGVRLPNGIVSNNVVLRACVMTPNCTAAHPCGLTPNCGGAVAINMVSGNAVALASALQAQGVASGVMQAGGMGMLVNPMTNQPINGITMGGYPQAGYPPIGYAPTGHSPGYPRYAAGMVGVAEMEDDDEVDEEEFLPPENRSAMPVPRFHKIPSNPTFQRSEGMPNTPEPQRTVAKPTTVAMSEQNDVSEKEYEAALDRAYLEGVSAAMNDVERKLEAKRQAAATAKLQEKILRQEEYLQQQLDEQERQQMLAMQRIQRERQLQLQQQQQLAKQQAEMMVTAVSEPKRLPPPSVVTRTSPQPSVNAQQLAESLKNGMNEAFAPLLGSNQTGAIQKVQVPVKSQPQPLPQAQNSAKPKVEVAAAKPEVPGRPPVASTPPRYGLQPDDEPTPVILQAQFSADGTTIRP